MSKIAALILSAAALNVPAYAADAASVAQPATSAAPALKPAANKAEPVPVPEPAHYKLMLLGIAVLLLFARTGKKREQPWTK